ncbi:MAG TPA: LapA family protein [Pseudomonadales bacterium]|nr:LapA family protein [Pseudomonadales bacterium]
MSFVKKWLFRVILFIVFIAALIAATDNSQEVALTFVSLKTPVAPLSWWVLAAFVIGVLFGMVINFFTNTKLRMAARKANKTVAQTNKELDKVKAAPAAPPAADS